MAALPPGKEFGLLSYDEGMIYENWMKAQKVVSPPSMIPEVTKPVPMKEVLTPVPMAKWLTQLNEDLPQLTEEPKMMGKLDQLDGPMAHQGPDDEKLSFDTTALEDITKEADLFVDQPDVEPVIVASDHGMVIASKMTEMSALELYQKYAKEWGGEMAGQPKISIPELDEIIKDVAVKAGLNPDDIAPLPGKVMGMTLPGQLGSITGQLVAKKMASDFNGLVLVEDGPGKLKPAPGMGITIVKQAVIRTEWQAGDANMWELDGPKGSKYKITHEDGKTRFYHVTNKHGAAVLERIGEGTGILIYNCVVAKFEGPEAFFELYGQSPIPDEMAIDEWPHCLKIQDVGEVPSLYPNTPEGKAIEAGKAIPFPSGFKTVDLASFSKELPKMVYEFEPLTVSKGPISAAEMTKAPEVKVIKETEAKVKQAIKLMKEAGVGFMSISSQHNPHEGVTFDMEIMVFDHDVAHAMLKAIHE